MDGTSISKKTKIFFDGNCVVCDMEIAHYARIQPDSFELIDISDPSFDSSRFGLNPKEVNLNMHVLTEAGEIKVGVDAFTHIWSQIPLYKIPSRVIRLPGVYTLAKIGYSIFARYRHLLPKKSKILRH